MNYLIDANQLSRASLEEFFLLADDIRKKPQNYTERLKNKVVATIFYEPSTRTRLSFETAALRLGASVISTENARDFSSAVKGETIEDTVRVVEGYVDAIVIRHHKDDALERAARVAKVPVINAGAGKGEHPTQSMLDLYTIWRKRNEIDGVRIAIIGDLLYGRTIHSLIKLLCLYDNVEVYSLADDVFELPKKYIDLMNANGVKFVKCDSFTDLPSDIDFLYTTRVQKERFPGEIDDYREFILNKEVMKNFSDTTYIMHPLPRCEEIATDLDDDPRLLVFKQAHNGLYVRMAILLKLIEE